MKAAAAYLEIPPSVRGAREAIAHQLARRLRPPVHDDEPRPGQPREARLPRGRPRAGHRPGGRAARRTMASSTSSSCAANAERSADLAHLLGDGPGVPAALRRRSGCADIEPGCRRCWSTPAIAGMALWQVLGDRPAAARPLRRRLVVVSALHRRGSPTPAPERGRGALGPVRAQPRHGPPHPRASPHRRRLSRDAGALPALLRPDPPRPARSRACCGSCCGSSTTSTGGVLRASSARRRERPRHDADARAAGPEDRGVRLRRPAGPRLLRREPHGDARRPRHRRAGARVRGAEDAWRTSSAASPSSPRTSSASATRAASAASSARSRT